MSAGSDAFLLALQKLLEAFYKLEDRWTVFWSRYHEAHGQRGVWFLDLGPKWQAFQSAFKEAAAHVLRCQRAMPRPEELPRLWTGWPPPWAIASSFPELLRLFGEKFAAWLPGVMDPKGGFAEWDWNTDFSQGFMGQFRPLFIEPLEGAIGVYKRFVTQQEAQELAKALASQEIAPQPPLAEPSSGAPSTGTVAPASQGGDEKAAEEGDERVEILTKLLSLYTNGVSDERFQKAATIIADKNLTTNEKLQKLDEVCPIPPDTSAQQLAHALGVSKSAIVGSQGWREHRRGTRERETLRRYEMHENRSRTYESPRRGE